LHLPTARRRVSGRTGSSQTLPTEVTDAQKYSYFGPQRRWFLVVRFFAFIGLVLSLSRFGLEDPNVGVMLLVVMLMIAVSLSGLYTSTRPRTLSLGTHKQTVRDWIDQVPPTVDVFLPSAGEPLDLLENTIRHVAALDYPGYVTVYALDDSGREEVRTLARRFGFVYLSRPDRGRLKKAGNLAYGQRHSKSDVITILDADFAPRPDYLLELMPYLADTDVGIVQAPQFFDTRKDDPWLQRAAGADQEMFYRWIQPSLDSIGATVCVGTCALYRRAALERVGGFAQLAHSEDIHTGVAMMRAGYTVRYVPVILAKGLCPDGIPPFVSQQYRWCTGSMTLMADAQFRSMSLTWKQRLCFWSGFGYYISTAVTAFTAFMPPIYLLWGHPNAIHDRDYLLLLPIVFAYPLIAALHFGRWDFGVLRVQMAQSFAHAVAIWDAWRGHTEDWVATGVAPIGNLGGRVGRVMVTWLVAVQALLWVGMFRDLANGSLSFHEIYPLILFSAFALYLHGPLIAATLRRPVAAPIPVMA
jgi:cellulose synthase (UDP-forming)